MVAGLLRDSVVLCSTLGRICNGHPASAVVKNQRLPNTKISNLSVRSSYEPGGRVVATTRHCIHAGTVRGTPTPTGKLCDQTSYTLPRW